MPSLNTPEPYLRELGRLVFNFNAAEHSYRRLMWLLVDPGDERVGQVATDGLDLVRSRETVLQLLDCRKLKQELIGEVSNLLAGFDRLRQDRNKFAHALWRIPNDAVDISEMHAARAPGRRVANYQEIANSNDPGTIAAVASEAAAIGEQFDSVIAAVRSALSGAA